MRYAFLLSIALVTACSRGEVATRAAAVIDTLPGGVVRVRNTAPTGWTDSSGFRLVEDLTITGTAGGTSELANPDGIAVDRRGRIYVVDGTIKLFGADGSFIRTVGRDGAGPGEYRAAMIATAGDQLLVQDPNLARLTVFDSAGSFVRSWRTACCMIAAPSADTAGLVTVLTSGDAPAQGSRYVRYTLDGVVRDTLELPPTTMTMWSLKTGYGGWRAVIPFTPRREVTAPPGGGLLTGWPTEYTIVLSRTGRDSARIFARSWTPPPISSARRAAETARYRDFIIKHRQNLGGVEQSEIDRVFREGDLPPTAPAYVGLATDDAGTIWVTTDPGDDSLHTHFDLFTAEGIWLGAVRAPTRLRPYGMTAWTREAVYSIQQTTEGLPVVKRYRVVRQAK